MAETSSSIDETKLARTVAIGLPVATVCAALAVGTVIGPATAILVLAAGVLLGVIMLFWGSIRVLTGDAPLDPALEELDLKAGGDALASRRKMLLRALKDLETEHGLGKIEDEDYEQIAGTYRAELKVVIRRMDEALAPHRAQAEAFVRERLGLHEPAKETAAKTAPARKAALEAPVAESRLACPKCGASNEKDAKFCKECATSLAKPVVPEKVEDANVE